MSAHLIEPPDAFTPVLQYENFTLTKLESSPKTRAQPPSDTRDWLWSSWSSGRTADDPLKKWMSTSETPFPRMVKCRDIPPQSISTSSSGSPRTTTLSLATVRPQLSRPVYQPPLITISSPSCICASAERRVSSPSGLIDHTIAPDADPSHAKSKSSENRGVSSSIVRAQTRSHKALRPCAFRPQATPT
jgi:hypothetical protein